MFPAIPEHVSLDSKARDRLLVMSLHTASGWNWCFPEAYVGFRAAPVQPSVRQPPRLARALLTLVRLTGLAVPSC